MNAGHLLGAEEHGSSFGGIKNEVIDGERLAVGIERGVVGILLGFDSCRQTYS